MVGLGPVQPDEQQPVLLSWIDLQIEPEEARDTLMEKCSTNGTPPHQSSGLLSDQRGTI
jgi:hypothetical protein